jgi:hypothetical protein
LYELALFESSASFGTAAVDLERLHDFRVVCPPQGLECQALVWSRGAVHEAAAEAGRSELLTVATALTSAIRTASPSHRRQLRCCGPYLQHHSNLDSTWFYSVASIITSASGTSSLQLRRFYTGLPDSALVTVTATSINGGARATDAMTQTVRETVWRPFVAESDTVPSRARDIIVPFRRR